MVNAWKLLERCADDQRAIDSGRSHVGTDRIDATVQLRKSQVAM
jgi:hypothetical protein